MYKKESELKIKAKAESHEGVVTENDIIQSSPFYVISGPPGSGKTTLIENLLIQKPFYAQKFHKVLFITPTEYTGISLTPENWFPSVKFSWIEEKIEEQFKIGGVRNILLIFDDCVTDLAGKAHDDLFLKLFYNRRHYKEGINISIIIATQKYNGIPLRFRTGITGIWLFQSNKSEWESIKKDINFDALDKLRKIEHILFKNKGDCLYINLLNKKAYHNFDLLLI